jgi:hypothetical protein
MVAELAEQLEDLEVEEEVRTFTLKCIGAFGALHAALFQPLCPLFPVLMIAWPSQPMPVQALY